MYPRYMPVRSLLNFSQEIDWKKEVKNARNFNIQDYDSNEDED